MAADGGVSLVQPEPSAELKKLGHDVHNALTTLREGLDAKNTETVRKVETFFKRYEDENQKFARDFAAHQKAQAELKEALETSEKKGGDLQKRIDDLVISFATKGGAAKVDAREADEYKGFFAFLQKGTNPNGGFTAFRPDIDVKTLRTDSEVQGGYLIPQVMDAEINSLVSLAA